MSLRAKITGVTVALLAIGLIAAGFGTAVFLRNTLIANLNEQLAQIAATDPAKSVFSLASDGTTFVVDPNAVEPDYFLAVYGPDGVLQAHTGGRDVASPVIPPAFPLELAVTSSDSFELASAEGGAPYHAVVSVLEGPNGGNLYTQLVAQSIAPVDRVVTSYLGIYGVLALITIIAGAFLTRLLVTLAFRSLGQVETTAMSIASGDFSQRMTDIEPGTEVGRLKTAINTMLGRIDGALSERDATVRQMRRFIGDASHELRTPLVTVRGYAELYRMGAITSDEDVAQAMSRIESEAKRMGVLVEDLLALARLDERRDVVIAPVDLRPVARDAALDVRAAAPQRPVTVIDTTIVAPPPPEPELIAEPAVELGPDAPSRRAAPPTSAIARAGVSTLSLLRRRPRPVPASRATGAEIPPPAAPSDDVLRASAPASAPPIVLGDENRIRQVVTNLLGNARRFTSEDSPIEVKVGVDGPTRMGWIEVIDHGEGIPEQLRDKIFQRFWRADTSRTRETGGAGLGLSIVSSIVEALHGSVDVTETSGGGATFRVGFPLAPPADAAEHLLIETQPLPMTRGSGIPTP
ncbi:sensor histidine kinase [Microbacterium rhizomatis]|uniref:sensor histidine kinase n=1 Tax=Microbacterium rhizomatis TaxID=1631477 RepID=UPI001FEB8BE9|nr:HAMP domain-containing sensor histidine kinase [Microbacterium rhizomatis]